MTFATTLSTISPYLIIGVRHGTAGLEVANPVVPHPARAGLPAFALSTPKLPVQMNYPTRFVSLVLTANTAVPGRYPTFTSLVSVFALKGDNLRSFLVAFALKGDNLGSSVIRCAFQGDNIGSFLICFASQGDNFGSFDFLLFL